MGCSKSKVAEANKGSEAANPVVEKKVESGQAPENTEKPVPEQEEMGSAPPPPKAPPPKVTPPIKAQDENETVQEVEQAAVEEIKEANEMEGNNTENA